MARQDAPETASESTTGRSRRRLLTAAAGALGLLAGETIAAAGPAQAANGDNLVLGQDNGATRPTFLQNTGTDTLNAALQLDSQALASSATLTATNIDGTGGAISGIASPGEGVYGRSGLTDGTNPTGTRNGVHGVTDSPSDSAVWGEAVAGGFGVSGSTNSTSIIGPAGVSGTNAGTGPAVRGLNDNGGAALLGLAATSEGLYAQSGTTAGASPGSTRNGVHAVSDSKTDSAVWGEAVAGGYGVSGSTSTKGHNGPAGVYGTNFGTGPAVKGLNLSGGDAVLGLTTSAAIGGGAAVQGKNLGSGPGVLGSSKGGAGVHGTATSGGIGVIAENNSHTGGGALSVVGTSFFNRSGTALIEGSKTSATVHPPGGILDSALVLATLQNALHGIWVTSAVPDPAAGSVKISLNRAPGAGRTAHVAWFVVN
jgi:hypothetical protein